MLARVFQSPSPSTSATNPNVQPAIATQSRPSFSLSFPTGSSSKSLKDLPSTFDEVLFSNTNDNKFANLPHRLEEPASPEGFLYSPDQSLSSQTPIYDSRKSNSAVDVSKGGFSTPQSASVAGSRRESSSSTKNNSTAALLSFPFLKSPAPSESSEHRRRSIRHGSASSPDLKTLSKKGRANSTPVNSMDNSKSRSLSRPPNGKPLPVPNNAIQSSTSNNTLNSFVLVSSDAPVPFPQHGRKSSSSSYDVKKGKGIRQKGEGEDRERLVSDGKMKGFQNTMRKTSGFFRKRFGPSTSSSPSTPTSNNFVLTSSIPTPPVPLIPSNFQTINTRSPNSGDVEELETPIRQLSSTERRRSMSFSGSSSSIAQLVSKITAGPSSNLEYQPRDEESFKQDVQSWEHDMDNLFARLGKSMENQRSSFSRMSGRSSPPPSTSRERQTSLDDRPRGDEKRRPSVWDQNWNIAPSNSNRTITPSNNITSPYKNKMMSQSTSALPSGFGIETEEIPETPPLPPSIRLVSNSSSMDSVSTTDSDAIRRLASDLKNSANGNSSNKRLSYVGAGLEPIREAHSRENSVATPHSRLSIPNEDTNRSPSASDKKRRASFIDSPLSSPKLEVPVITQSPASIHNSSNKTQPQTTSRKGTRSSISGYPGTTPSTTRTPSAANSSVTSLDSDKVKRDLHEDELKFSGNRSVSPGGTTLEDKARELALKAWHEEDSFLKRDKIAEWLGGVNKLNKATCTAYMELFDFGGLRLDRAFRKLCEKLYLKAETQQVDRILEEFSKRYWDQNRGLIYGSSDIVHVIAYSLLMLNTDLHIVDAPTHMSRNQFVKNTMSAIHTHRSSTLDVLQDNNTNLSLAEDDNGVSTEEPGTIRQSLDKAQETLASKPTGTFKARSKRTGSLSSWQTPHQTDSPEASTTNLGRKTNAPSNQSYTDLKSQRSGSFTKTGTAVRDRWWDAEVETLLKEMYVEVKSQPVFMIASSSSLQLPDSRPSLSLPNGSPHGAWGGLHRTGSRRSANSYGSERNKRASIRGFGTFLGPNSSENNLRPVSPSFSSFSDEMGDASAYSLRQAPSIGFANSLTSTIIREQQEDDTESISGHSITEEELALMGAPWAKEGLLHRKHYWESASKRSKDKNWTQAFVVISKGEMQMFKFGEGGGNMGLVMGGGNWTTNAQSMGDISLIHALCSSLPPPGYSKDRQHVFVLTLSDGGSYFFQAGTEDLVNEWVMTCNYWAARLSREPQEGVSNHEYGWGSFEVDHEQIADEDSGRPSSIKSGKSRKSMSVVREAVGFQHLNDKVVIGDWKPPITPFSKTNLGEDEQLENLKRHVSAMKANLDRHQELRSPMIVSYPPRSQNGAKAIANWEKKSKWLLAEIVKFGTYVEVLERSIKLRNKKRDEKRIEDLLKVADAVDDAELHNLSTVDLTKTISRTDENRGDDPLPTPVSPRQPSSSRSSVSAHSSRSPVNRDQQSFRSRLTSSGYREPVSPREDSSVTNERPSLAKRNSAMTTDSTIASTVDEFFDLSPHSGKSSFDQGDVTLPKMS